MFRYVGRETQCLAAVARRSRVPGERRRIVDSSYREDGSGSLSVLFVHETQQRVLASDHVRCERNEPCRQLLARRKAGMRSDVAEAEDIRTPLPHAAGIPGSPHTVLMSLLSLNSSTCVSCWHLPIARHGRFLATLEIPKTANGNARASFRTSDGWHPCANNSRDPEELAWLKTLSVRPFGKALSRHLCTHTGNNGATNAPTERITRFRRDPLGKARD